MSDPGAGPICGSLKQPNGYRNSNATTYELRRCTNGRSLNTLQDVAQPGLPAPTATPPPSDYVWHPSQTPRTCTSTSR